MKPRLDVLTALRFPAAMLVYLHHVESHFGVPTELFPLRRVFVSCFFALSGFLLYLIYSRPDRPFSTAAFYKRRAARIYPLHWAVLLLTFAFFWSREIALFNADATARLVNIGLRATLLQSWYPKPEFMAFGGVTWSLSVILFFYVSFPLLLKFKQHLWLVFATLLSGCILFLWVFCAYPDLPITGSLDSIDLVHYFPPFRLAEFVLGMIAAQVYLKGWAKPVARNWVVASFLDVGLILACIYWWPMAEQFARQELEISRVQQLLREAQDTVFTSSSAAAEYNNGVFRFALYQWFLFAGYAIPGAAIIYWFSCSTGVLARSLNSSVLVFLGNLSFALFLCHRPIILWLEPLIAPWGIAPGIALVFCTCCVLMVSTLLYYLVERPFSNMLGTKVTGLKNTSSIAPRRSRGNEIGSWLLVVSGLVALFVFQSKLPRVRNIELSNGLTVYVNGISERPGLFEFSIAWQAEKPLEGDLWAIHTTEHGKVKNRIHAAAFKAKGGRYLPSGFKLLRFRPDGKKLSGLVKLVFIEPGSKPPESILDCNPWDGSLSTVWASQSRPSHEFVFQNGLVVNIDRVEMRSNVLVVNLSPHFSQHKETKPPFFA